MEIRPIDSSQALPPGTRIEEFVIERILGSGGFGITYLAQDARQRLSERSMTVVESAGYTPFEQL